MSNTTLVFHDTTLQASAVDSRGLVNSLRWEQSAMTGNTVLFANTNVTATSIENVLYGLQLTSTPLARTSVAFVNSTLSATVGGSALKPGAGYAFYLLLSPLAESTIRLINATLRAATEGRGTACVFYFFGQHHHAE